MMKIGLQFFLPLLLWLSTAAWAGEVVVIGHPLLGKMNVDMIHKIFMGKMLTAEGVFLTPVNLKSSALRARFLQTFLKQSDDQYAAYWMVRRHIGKGLPPRELDSSAEVVHFVQNTPGAIGYIDEIDLKQGFNVIVR